MHEISDWRSELADICLNSLVTILLMLISAIQTYGGLCVRDKTWNFTKIGLFLCRCRDLIFFQKVTFLHFSRLFKTLRPLKFYWQTPRGLTFSKLQIYSCGRSRTCGQGIDCQGCDKNSRHLAIFYGSVNRISAQKRVYWKREPVEPSYGSVGIRLLGIIAATPWHLASLWKIPKNLGT